MRRGTWLQHRLPRLRVGVARSCVPRQAMGREMSDSIAALAAAQREVFRCQRALSRGTPVRFWIKRLEDAAKRYEAAACILRMQLMTLGV